MASATRRSRGLITGAFLAISGLALALRWVYPTLIEFWYDEAYHTRLALFIAHYGYRPVFGVNASVGVRQFPLFLYLNALPLRFWPHPLAAFYFVAGLNALAIPLTYFLGRRYWGSQVGFVAALLFAVSAWAVLYARKIWVLNISSFTVLFAIAFFRAFVDDASWAWPLAWVAAAVLVGLHLAGLAFVVILTMAMVLRARRLPWPWALSGVLLFVLALSPYLVADARQGWPNVRGFLAYSGGPGSVSLDVWRLAFQLSSGQGVAALAGSNAAVFVRRLPRLGFLSQTFYVVLGLALLHAVARALRDTPVRRRKYLALLLWFMVPLLLQTYHTRPVYPHYLTILYPAPYLLVAAWLADGLAWARRRVGGKALSWARWATAAFIVAWCLWQLIQLFAIWRFVDTQPTPGGFGTPLKYPLMAAQKARAWADGQEIIIVAPEGELEWNPSRQMFDVLLFEHNRRFIDGNTTVVVPKRAAVYLVGPVAEEAPEFAATVRFLTHQLGAQEVGSVGTPNGERYRILRYEPASRRLPAGFHVWDPPITLENGTRLLAYAIGQGSQGWEVWVAWEVDATSPQMYRLYVHGLNARGDPVAVGDASGLLPYFRRQGDWVFTHVLLKPSARIHALRVGMYTYPGQQRVRIVEPTPWAGKDGVLIPGAR